jgi:ABC-type Fe3+ transport system permease subunit
MSAQRRSLFWSASVPWSARGRTLTAVLGAAVLSLAVAAPASVAAVVNRDNSYQLFERCANFLSTIPRLRVRARTAAV